LLFLYGNGRNGKSTFTGVLEKLISPYWIKSRADLLMATRRGEPRQGPTPELVRMRGKRLVTVSEVQQDHRLHEALIKDLTGGDAITGRNLYENEITFQPSHKIWMYGNHKPEIKGTDLGIRRRVKLIPFDQQLAAEDVDTSLPEKLEAELPGIMAWAVQGCLKWQKSGLGDPAEIRQATDDYFAENDTVCRFIDECCKAALPGFGDFTSVVFEKYKLWCKDETEDPIKQKSFSIDLKRRGYEITRHSSGKSMFSALEIIK
ncbi:MAG: phage/plasmid primase, P4 family, partial [Armatimonadota bacterium]